MLWADFEGVSAGTAKSAASAPPQPHPGNTRYIEELFGGARFSDSSLLRRAITDKTHNRRFEKQYKPLDYLGDAVLTLALRDICYSREGLFGTTRPEPAIQELMRNSSLEEAGRRTGLDKVILFERNGVVIRDASKLPDLLVANITEAVLGAVFLNGGLAAATDATKALFGGRLRPLCTNAASNPLDTAIIPAKTLPPLLGKIEKMLGVGLSEPEIFERLRELPPHERARVFNRLIRLGSAAASLAAREHTYDETSRLKEFHTDGRHKGGNPYGIHPPKRVRAFPRRLGPAIGELLKESFTDSPPPTGHRRAAFLMLGLLVRDRGYAAAKTALYRATAGA